MFYALKNCILKQAFRFHQGAYRSHGTHTKLRTLYLKATNQECIFRMLMKSNFSRVILNMCECCSFNNKLRKGFSRNDTSYNRSISHTIVLPLLISLTKPSFPFLPSPTDSLINPYLLPNSHSNCQNDRQYQSLLPNSVPSDKMHQVFVSKFFCKPKIYNF